MRRPFRPPAGPAQRFQQARANLQFMQANPGAFSQNQLFDAQVRARQAQQAFERAQKQASGGPDFFDRAQTALMSSRFGAGGAGGGLGPLMPLVGRTLAIFGKLNPAVSLAATGFGLLTATAATFQRTLASAAQTAGAMGSAGLLSGGGAQTIGGLTSLGIPAGQIADLAAALHQRRASDPFAMLAGGFTLPRPFGNPDEAKELQEKIEELRVTRQLHGAEAQLVQARMLGLEGVLDLINVSPRVRAAQQEAGRLSGEIFNPKFTQDARDFNAAQRNVDDAWKRLEGSLSKPFLENATTALLKFANAVDKVSEGANRHPGAVRGGASTAAGVAIGLPFGPLGVLAATLAAAKFQEWLSRITGKTPSDPQTQATQDLTDAMRRNNELMMMMIHGGGPRSRGAIPPALLSFNNRQAMLDARLDLRGFRF